MEIFFSSGERSLRIWMFSLEVKAGADFRKRGCIWHQSCVIFRCQCTSHLCNDNFPEGLWTHASLHFWTNVVLHKPEFYEKLPLSATSFLGEKDKTSCKPPALPIFCLVGHDRVSVVCQITGGVMSMWKTFKMLWLSDLVLRFILLASNLKSEHYILPILLECYYTLIRSFRYTLNWCFCKTVVYLLVWGFVLFCGFILFDFSCFDRSMYGLNCFVCSLNYLGLCLWIKPIDNLWLFCSRYNKEPNFLYLEKEGDVQGSISNRKYWSLYCVQKHRPQCWMQRAERGSAYLTKAFKNLLPTTRTLNLKQFFEVLK